MQQYTHTWYISPPRKTTGAGSFVANEDGMKALKYRLVPEKQQALITIVGQAISHSCSSKDYTEIIAYP